jgi:hypothetical protein
LKGYIPRQHIRYHRLIGLIRYREMKAVFCWFILRELGYKRFNVDSDRTVDTIQWRFVPDYPDKRFVIVNCNIEVGIRPF